MSGSSDTTPLALPPSTLDATTPQPEDLVPLAEAAKRVDRSIRTLREWVRRGELTRYEGKAVKGSAPILVSVAQLWQLAATTKTAEPPRPGGREDAALDDSALDDGLEEEDGLPLVEDVFADPGVVAPEVEPVESAPERVSASTSATELALQALLKEAQQAREIAQLKAKVAEAERDAALARLQALQVTASAKQEAKEEAAWAVQQAQQQLVSALQVQLQRERDALDACKAEILSLRSEAEVLRSAQNLPWWRRLLPG